MWFCPEVYIYNSNIDWFQREYNTDVYFVSSDLKYVLIAYDIQKVSIQLSIQNISQYFCMYCLLELYNFLKN